MGMYDNIKCEYPLPDGYQTDENSQTHSLDDDMSSYLITADGRLALTHSGYCDGMKAEFTYLDYTGAVEFGFCNHHQGCPENFCTKDDAPYVHKTYTALFDAGKLLKITGGNAPQWNPNAIHVGCSEYAELHKDDDAERERVWKQSRADEHAKAMKLAHDGKFLEAAEIESSIASGTWDEPSFSVLHRSAAQLYLDAGKPAKALHQLSEWAERQRHCHRPVPAELNAEIVAVLRAIADKFESLPAPSAR